MQWVEDFYSTTARWWAKAEAHITRRDHDRVDRLHEHCGTEAQQILELGAGYCTTAAAMALAGHDVTAIEISDRAQYAPQFVNDLTPGELTIIRHDFYSVELAYDFEVVCYWNGFGVGTDTDQRRLLARVAQDWLAPNGVVLMDVFNPYVWARWNGELNHRRPRPDDGYDHEVYQRVEFDPVTCTAADTWWSADNPRDSVTQYLRCYTPADLTLLLEGTGLQLTKIEVGGETFNSGVHFGARGLLHDDHEYLAVLTHAPNPDKESCSQDSAVN